MDKPHPKDFSDSHEYRFAYSAWHAARIAQAKAELGSANCYGEWVITDSLGIEPEQRILTCLRSGAGWDPRQPERSECLGPENHPGWEIKGERVYPRRFTACLELIGGQPVRFKTREELEQAAQIGKAREAAKREAKDREDHPLFAGMTVE